MQSVFAHQILIPLWRSCYLSQVQKILLTLTKPCRPFATVSISVLVSPVEEVYMTSKLYAKFLTVSTY